MQYSNFVMLNNVHADLSTAVSSLATTIQLVAGQGARFGNVFPQIATLQSISAEGKVTKREIVRITARNNDNLTVERHYAPCPENDDANSQTQTSSSFQADDTISLLIPKEIFDKIYDAINDIYDNGVNKLRTEIVSGLDIHVNSGTVLVGSAYYNFAGDTITLTDNATNYVEIDEDGNLVTNTTDWNEENTKIAIVTTISGEVSSIIDRRLGTIGGKIGGMNIHELTEKDDIDPNDEFVLSDSENIWNNKKTKGGNFLGIGTGYAIENISKGNMVFSEALSNETTQKIGIGFSQAQKISLKMIGNGVEFNSIKLQLSKYGSPDQLNIRIESDESGSPSGNLIDNDAYGSVSGSDITTVCSEETISLAGNITIPQGTICHIVISIETVDATNFFYVRGSTRTPNLFKIKQYDGNSWIDYVDVNPPYNVASMETASNKSYGRAIYGGISCRTSGTYDYILACTNYTTLFMLRAAKGSLIYNFAETSQLSVGTSMVGGSMNPSGTKIMCLFNKNSGAVYTATLNTAFNLGGIGSQTNTSLSTMGFPSSVYSNYSCGCFSNDGKHMYVGMGTIPVIYQMDFTTAFDPSTYSNPSKYKTFAPGLTGGITGLTISDDGHWFYFGNSNKIHCAYMSTAFDISTASYIGERNLGSVANLGGLGFLPGGNMLVGNSTLIYEYSSQRIYGDNSLLNISMDGIYSSIVGKADKNMTFSPSYIPMASVGNYNVGDLAKYNISYNNNLQNLIPGTKYYLGTDGQVGTNSSTIEVGIAIEPTILKLKQTY